MATEASPLLSTSNGVDGFAKPTPPPNPPHNAPRLPLRGILPFLPITSASPLLPARLAVCAIVGVACALVAALYYAALDLLLHLTWTALPKALTTHTALLPPHLHVLYIPLIAFPYAALVGVAVRALGEPGDLASTVRDVHERGFVHAYHAVPMSAASQVSIVGGGALGPEAPLVAICAAVSGWVSRVVLGATEKEVVRKHTLCGMASALAAFFGAPLGGALFALEVNHRFGYEFVEHAMEAVLSGVCCMVVFRAIVRMPIGPIWAFLDPNTGAHTTLPPTSALMVTVGAAIGVAGAAIAVAFARAHWLILGRFERAGLMHRPILRALAGCAGVVAVGVLVPHTMFWGEFEFQTIANALPAASLPHVWPPRGLAGFELTGVWTGIALGVAKLLVISLSVSGGYCGGFIFPLFAAGAGFGVALSCAVEGVPRAVATLSFAAALNVAVTRTPFATTLILSALAGEVNAAPPVLAAALVALFLTADLSFVDTQREREDPALTKGVLVDDRPPSHV